MTLGTRSGAAAMGSDVDDKNERPGLDLSFLERRPVRTDIPSLNTQDKLPDDRELHIDKLGDSKTLTVGRDISLKGDITECGTLIVEGHVDGTLDSARALEVLRGGRFVGSARVETATISGHFDGDLDVARDLLITASGKVTVSYGRLEIEHGGEVLGDVRVHE
jgi:cytoskeletal protein CcmA (bactofilin family)